MKLDGVSFESARSAAINTNTQRQGRQDGGIQQAEKAQNQKMRSERTVTENMARDTERQLEYTEEDLGKAVEKANKSFKPHNRRLEFEPHERTDRLMVKVVDTTTDEIIREIPPEKIIDMVADMLEMAGILVDERA